MARSSTRLVLICGLPASGKTTLARQLATTIPAIRLDKDQWTTELGLDVWDDGSRARVEGQLWALAQELLANGQSVILEWGHWARAERDEKRIGARGLGVGVELHVLHAPLEELIERAERRHASGEWTASPMTRAHFERWATIFDPPDEEELLLFDEPVTDAEVAVHPSDGAPSQELSFMCDDLDATIDELRGKGLDVDTDTRDEGWGVTTKLHLPGDLDLLLYEPRHPSPRG